MVATLALDLLHYSIASLISGWTSWRKKRALKNDTELANDPDLKFWKPINFPGLFLFWSKIICVMTAYAMLFIRIMPLLFPDTAAPHQ